MTLSNDRKNSRVSYKNDTLLILNDEEYPDCKTQNLSLSGVFIPNLFGPKVGDEGSLKIVLDRCTKSIIRASVKAIRVDSHGVALEFISIDSDSFFHLKRVVMYNSADPDSVVDELWP